MANILSYQAAPRYHHVAFTAHHVYSAILIGIEERSGLVSSIITGYKSLTRRHLVAAYSDEAKDWRKSTRKERRKHV